MKKVVFLLMAVIVLGLRPTPVQAQGKFDGYMVPEYYMFLNSSNPDLEGMHGLWLRRVYFTYNHTVAENITMRFRLEMNSPGDYTTATNLIPYVKDAYLNFKLGKQGLKVGLQGPPTYEKVEEIWGHRPLEKTPMDHFGLRSSRDIGIALSGHLDGSGTVSYHMMYGIGNARGETNKGKVFYGALGFKPVKGVYLEAYGDYEQQLPGTTYYVYQGFASYSGDFGRFGVLYSNKHQDIDGVELDYGIVSGFLVIKGGKSLEFIGRYDKTVGDGWETSFNGSRLAYFPFASNVNINYVIGAVSYQLVKNVWLIPNVKYAFYDQPELGEKPDADMWVNLTLYFKF